MESEILHASPERPNGKALIPFLVFLLCFLGSGIFFQIKGTEMAFYQMPAPVAILIGTVVAFFMFKGSMDQKFTLFAKGCGDINILTMCCIYLFAGAFASVAGEMGGVESTAFFGMSIIPPQFLVAGLFVISSFLALSIGSAMATVGAIVPIGLEIVAQTGSNATIMTAAVVCGAIFGDNLSMVSDTTIAATRTQGCELKDKFKMNFLIALPAAIVTIILFSIFGQMDVSAAMGSYEYSIIKVVPYILVLVLALIGINVFIVLGTGILSAIIIGMATGSFGLMTGIQGIYTGFTNMTEIFLLSMFTGGLAAMVTHYGGLAWALNKIKSFIRGPKSAEAGIAALATVADLTTANNTVAIIISGPIAKEISTKYKVDPRKSASLLDIWACIFQGIIPYGAQILLASSLSEGLISPIQIVPYMWYTFLLAGFAVLAIIIPYANGAIKKNPWDWESMKASEK